MQILWKPKGKAARTLEQVRVVEVLVGGASMTGTPVLLTTFCCSSQHANRSQ